MRLRNAKNFSISDNAPSPMTRPTTAKSNPAFISAEVAVAIEMGTEQNRASVTTRLTVACITNTNGFGQRK